MPTRIRSLDTRAILIRQALTALVTLLALWSGAGNALAQSPAAPTGVRVFAGSANNSIYWNPVPGATSYNLYRAMSHGAEGSVPLLTGIRSTSITNSSLVNGTPYFYQVTALYGTREGAKSAEVVGTPNSTQLPATPLAARAAAGSVTLNWSAIPGAVSYNILRTDPATFTTTVLSGVTGTSFNDTNVINGATYQYVVEAVDNGGSGSDSNTASAIPGDAPLSPPTGLRAVPGSTNISIAWNKVPGATSYNIYLATTPGGENSAPTITNISSNTKLISGLPTGTAYYFKIASVDASGESPLSTEISATTGTTLLDPPLLTAAAGLTKINLNWTATPGATAYNIFRSVDGTTFVLYKTVTGLTFADTAFTAGVSYYYTVAGVNSNGQGSVSNTASASGGSSGLPAPGGLRAIASSSSIQVAWNPVPGAAGYNIYRSTLTGKETLLSVSGSSASYFDNAVTSGTLYYYKVSAVYPATEGKLSVEISAKVGSPRLAAPILVANIPSGKLSLTWSVIAGAASYNLYRSGPGIPNAVLQQGLKPVGAADHVTVSDSKAVRGTPYVYTVAAVSKNGQGLVSSTVNATLGNVPLTPPTGLFAASSTTSVSISWNPVPGALSYNLFRSTTPGGEGVIPIALGLFNSYFDTDVVSGTTYYYTLTAVDNDGQSLQSIEISGKPGSTVLKAPIVTSNATTTQTVLNWSPVAGATSYDVFRAYPGSGGYFMVQERISATTFTDSDISPGVVYSYYVYAVNADGAGSRSNTVTASAGSTPLSAPVGLYATTGTGSIALNWNPVYGATSYNVYRSTTPGGEGVVPYAVGQNGSLFDSKVTDGTVYYYTVTAVDANGQSLQSSEISAISGTSTLAAPVLSATASGGQVNLSWTNVTGAASYNLFRRISGGDFILYKQGLTGTSFVDSSVISGATYTYYIAAVRINGQGTNSTQVNATP